MDYLRADHRFIAQINDTLSEKEMTKLSETFKENGGSWEAVFLGGSVEDVVALKKLVKEYVKKKSRPD
jgi:hypothetical protein